MKKFLGAVLVIIMALFGFMACNNDSPNENGGAGGGINSSIAAKGNILIAYFSCTNTTEAIAKHIEAQTKGTLYEIVPQDPYTAEDLRYYTGGRADREQADAAARPSIKGSVESCIL